MQHTITIDHDTYESMKRELEVLKAIENDKFCRFVEFVDRLSDSRAKVNTKYCINTFIEMELEKYRDLQSKLQETWEI